MNIKSRHSQLYSGLKSLLVFGLIAFIAISCDDDVGPNDPGTENAHIDFHLTDAPAFYDEVNIDIQGLRIHFFPDSADTADTAGTEGQWIDLPVEPFRINLLELNNGADSLISSADLDPGHYSELRLVLGNDNNVVIDSTAYDLTVPSGQSSGYKIKFNTDLEAGDAMEVTIDFDAAGSVHQAGNSGQYILNPVLKAFVTSGGDIVTGSVTGAIEPGEAEATVYAIMDEDTTSTQADTLGGFTIVGLDEGVYDISIQPGNELYNDTTLTGIQINAGEENDLGNISLSAADTLAQ